jgi:Uncharacterized protein conserved in bacteria
MKNYKFEAFLLMIGLIVMGFFVMLGLGRVNQSPRTVNVKGLAEMNVDATKVIWPIQVKLVSNDMNTIYSKINESNEAVVKFLKDNGLTDEEISVNAPLVVDRAANMYDNDWKQRYNAIAKIVVTSKKVALVRSLMSRQGELMKQGVAVTDQEYGTSIVYEYTELNSIKPQMIEEATRNARAAAEKFANDSNSKLGKIKTATQGQFSIENIDENTPFIKHVRVVTNVTYFLED